MSIEHREVVVIGGGQAGRAAGHFLAEQGRDFVILEAAGTPAAAWRERWDSLRLFTPARYDGLPGKPFPGDPDRYPARDEVVDYLTDYARELPVELGSRVRRLSREDGGYRVELDSATVTADQVIVATGPFQTPRTPAWAAELEAPRLHSADYRTPSQVAGGPVLVVGGGNTGDTLIGSSPRRIRRQGVRLHPRATSASGATVRFADGGMLDVATVIWATGFALDHAWIDVSEAFGADGAVLQQRGVTPADGLYFLGLPWMHTRGSALLGWVGHDAAHVAAQIAARRRVLSPV
ncbi:MAG TPA: NAD(P)-binding domain-containing protein [Solirubrobacter sp.]|nr:NAD(P)-binding domain-containing protein [Solirubrobacter sp.]